MITMKTRTLWLIFLSACIIGTGLQIWVEGWDDFNIRLGDPAFALLMYGPCILPLLLISAPFCAFAGRRIAESKQRSQSEGFLLGLVFGPLGVFIVASLPDKRDEE